MITQHNSNPTGTLVTFKVRADPGSTDSVAGDFNGWDPVANPLTDPNGTGDFSAVIPLQPGTHEYKFVINGAWYADIECKDWALNSHGTLNSVCMV